MRTKWKLLTALMLIVTCVGGSRSLADESGRICKTETDPGGIAIPYQLFVPLDYDKAKQYPLVVCFHGSGEMKKPEYAAVTAQSTALLRPEMRAKYPAFILVPQTKAGWATVDKRTRKASITDSPESIPMKLSLKIIANVMSEYSIDPARLYVGGQSMGGVATWDIIERHPDLFAAAVPICGFGDLSEASKIRCPVWVFHGAKDHTVPVGCSRDMVEAIKKAGGNVKYTEYPDIDHGSWTPAWKEAELAPWLFAQHLSK